MGYINRFRVEYEYKNEKDYRDFYLSDIQVKNSILPINEKIELMFRNFLKDKNISLKDVSKIRALELKRLNNNQ